MRKKLKTDTGMKTFKALIILLLLTVTVFGQISNDIKEEKPYIEVTGMAEKEIIPDEIYIAITIRERHEGREKISIDKQEADLKEAIKSIGISLDNLSLSDANANYIRVKWSKKDVITKKEYVLKVENALTVGKVFEKLDKLKIIDAYISKVSHSRILEFEKEVRVMAIKAAKEKADYLLEAIGEQTGKALKVNEVNPNYLQDDSYLNVRGARNEGYSYFIDGVKMKSSDKVVTQFKKIKLQASIYVKFEIK
jgi:hypothetical protein